MSHDAALLHRRRLRLRVPAHRHGIVRARRVGASGLVVVDGLVVRAHGASSPGFKMRTLPCARNEVSQSSSSLSTCCCNNISWMRSAIVASAGGAIFSFSYAGIIVFW